MYLFVVEYIWWFVVDGVEICVILDDDVYWVYFDGWLYECLN